MSLKGRAVAAWNATIVAAVMIGSFRSVLYIHQRRDELDGIAECGGCDVDRFSGEGLCPDHIDLLDRMPKPRGLWLARYLRVD